MTPVRILIADDHTLVRQGLRQLCEGLGGFSVVAEAENGSEAVTLAREAGRPVRVVYDRLEEMSYAAFRPGAESRFAALTGQDGSRSPTRSRPSKQRDRIMLKTSAKGMFTYPMPADAIITAVNKTNSSAI